MIKALRNMIIFCVVIVVLAVAGLYVFVQFVGLDRYRGQITAKISDAIGRKVELSHIGLNLSLRNGILVRLEGFRMADDQAFGSEPFISVKSLDVGVDILAYLKTKQLTVTNITIQSPAVRVIKGKGETFNFETLVKKDNPKSDSGSAAEKPAPSADSSPAPLDQAASSEEESWKNMTIQRVSIIGASVEYIDRTGDVPLAATVGDIDLNVRNFNFQSSFPYDVKASFLNLKQNLSGRGQARIVLDKQTFVMEDSVFDFDLAQIDVERLIQVVPSVKDCGIDGGFQGQVKKQIKYLAVGPDGIQTLKGRVDVLDGLFPTVFLPQAVHNIDMNASFDEKTISFDNVSANIASGRVEASGNVTDYLSNPQMTIQILLDGLDVADVLAKQALPVKIEGKINGQINGAVPLNDPDAILSTANLKTVMDVSDARLKDVNVLRTVFDKISFLPGLVEEIQEEMPEKYRALLDKKDTELHVVQLTASLVNNRVVIDKLYVKADGFALFAKGEMTFDQNIRFVSRVVVAEELSAKMLESVPELVALQNPSGQIEIPLKTYQGPLYQFRTYPDVGETTQRVIIEKGKQELRKVLMKVLDVDEEDTPSQDSQSPDGQNSGSQQAPEEIKIKDVLDILLK